MNFFTNKTRRSFIFIFVFVSFFLFTNNSIAAYFQSQVIGQPTWKISAPTGITTGGITKDGVKIKCSDIQVGTVPTPSASNKGFFITGQLYLGSSIIASSKTQYTSFNIYNPSTLRYPNTSRTVIFSSGNNTICTDPLRFTWAYVDSFGLHYADGMCINTTNLTVAKDTLGTGTGTISASGNLVNNLKTVSCGSSCSSVNAEFNTSFQARSDVSPSLLGCYTYQNSEVNLIATPDTCSNFITWSGIELGDPCYGQTNQLTCKLKMPYGIVGFPTTRNITAKFDTKKYTITASVGVGGTISPSGNLLVNCGANQTYTITPDTDYRISNVVVDGVSQGAISSYTFSNITSNHTISANFLRVYTLRVNKTMQNNDYGVCGLVQSSPNGLNIYDNTSSGSKLFDSGSSVSLSASGGWRVDDPSKDNFYCSFNNWSDACSGTNSTCSVSMNQNKVATAIFNTTPVYTLSLYRDGSVGGNFSLSGNGLSGIPREGSEKTSYYINGDNAYMQFNIEDSPIVYDWQGCTPVYYDNTIKPNPSPGNTTNRCAVLMNGHKNVTAIVKQRFALSAKISGFGYMISSPTGIDSSFSSSYFWDHSEVLLTPVATSNSTFIGWSGACSGLEPCIVLMDQNKSVTANFMASNQSIVTFDKQGGVPGYGDDSVLATMGLPMPRAIAPIRVGEYTFGGYYTSVNGGGDRYYDGNMASTRNWDFYNNRTLYAYWLPWLSF